MLIERVPSYCVYVRGVGTRDAWLGIQALHTIPPSLPWFVLRIQVKNLQMLLKMLLLVVGWMLQLLANDPVLMGKSCRGWWVGAFDAPTHLQTLSIKAISICDSHGDGVCVWGEFGFVWSLCSM